jgi:1-acyl-sn-glycerol-3-phosphate acyltransferase
MELNRKQTNEEIAKHELNKDFNSHLNPVEWDNCYPVDGSFKYLHPGFTTSIKYFFYKIFEIKPFVKKVNKDFKTVVYGKENLKGIKSAIATSNHVNKFDCLVIKNALESYHHKVYVTSAPFNNQKGHFGDLMRAGGLMPLSDNLSAMKNFNKAMEEMLNKKTFVVFYPEQAMWLYYRKPRPYKDGAYHYAAKHNKPIIPLFITFTDSDTLDEEGLPKQIFNLHIMKPIYPKKELSLKENIEYLRNENARVTKEKYEEFYKIPLTYLEKGSN